jgi:hypothetical protein
MANVCDQMDNFSREMKNSMWRTFVLKTTNVGKRHKNN